MILFKFCGVDTSVPLTNQVGVGYCLTLQKEHELALLGMKGEQAAKIADYERKLKDLQQEVEKYRILAGIESLTHGLGDDDQLTTSTHKPLPKLQLSEEQSPQYEVCSSYSLFVMKYLVY